MCIYASARGFTLVELIISIVISSVAFSLMMFTFLPNTKSAVTPLIETKASLIAQGYLEEIISKRFDENSFVGGNPRCDESGQSACSAVLGSDGEARALFDDVDDYHNVSDQPPLDALGNAVVNASGYRVSVQVSYAGADFGLPAQALKKIEVTVSGPRDFSAVFSTYKGNY